MREVWVASPVETRFGVGETVGVGIGAAATLTMVAWDSSSDVAPWLSAPTVMKAMTAIEPPMIPTTTMNENTVNDSVVGLHESDHQSESAPRPKRRRSRRWSRWIFIAAFVALVVAAYSVPVPYYTISPGQALDVGPLVKVVGGPTDNDKGQFLLTTVSLGQASLIEALAGWLDSSTDVVEERVIRPPSVSPDELTKLGLQQMASSKETALGVAFEYLGFDAISGAGAKVVAVEPDTPATSRLQTGDIIVSANGTRITDHFQLVKLIRAAHPGDVVDLEARTESDTSTRHVQIQLGSSPSSAEQGFLGVQLSTFDFRIDTPFEVKLESEEIGGPSAGLAYTLQVLDVITAGELTGGRKIAVTGTIELDGSVGEVGGVAQKARAVRDAKADVFLVPTAEQEAVRKVIGKDVEVLGVDSIDQAVATLVRLGGQAPKLSADEVARLGSSAT